MYTKTNNTSALKLFQQIVGAIRSCHTVDSTVLAAVDALGWQFNVDRAVALMMDELEHELEIKAEYSREPYKKIGGGRYQLRPGSEMYRLLSQGRPVPLTDIHAQTGPSTMQPELDQFLRDSNSKAVISFPLLSQTSLLGCLTLHYCQDDKRFSEDILEVGEAFAEELSRVIKATNMQNTTLLDGRVFTGSSLSLVVVEPSTFRIVKTNAAAAQLLDGNEADMPTLPFLELFGDSDAARIKEAAAKLGPKNPSVHLPNLLAPSVGGQTVYLDAALSILENDDHQQILISFCPAEKSSAGTVVSAPSTQEAPTGKVEELMSSLSRQLNWERLTRQIVSKMHSSLDRDTVLQMAADSLGRALRASACLIVRTDSPTASIVTHEYADPNLSPLGLGRSGQLPPGALGLLKQKTFAIADIAGSGRQSGFLKEDLTAFADNAVGALLSTPIIYHGSLYGVIVVQNSDPREWSPQEIETIETVSQQAAIALSNAQAYTMLKDQLFNMNLISNLTQQLTNALDLAGRNARHDSRPETPISEPPATPLSSRELEVLKLIASGLANREIAQKLFLTESTVELHASRIRKKLKLKSRTALVKYACDNHLV
jgi:GAF domain-containing protein